MTLRVYEYDIHDKKCGDYKGHYTIKEGVEPLGKENERLIQIFKDKSIKG